ncbi:MAG: hypothetical protein HY826_01595, partial [Actinobacteria bacterium]|nr:hypothetical protein [Actinomycetota bacterium]
WHSSIFNVASLFENGTWQSDGFRLANGFIMTLAIIEWTRRLRRLTTVPLAPGSIPILMGVPVLIAIGLANPSYFVSSPSPDLCAALVAVVAFGYLIDFLFEPTKVHAVGALVLCGLAMTFRPINAVMLAAAVVLVVVLRRRGVLSVGAKAVFRFASPALLLIVAFWTHSTIVSGYPILPTPVQVSPFHWAVPPALIKNDLRWIESSAKKPGLSPDEVLGDWSWFPEWWSRTSGSYSVFFAVLTLSFVVLGVASRMDRVSVTRRSGIAVVIALLPIAVWFTAAPEPRFGFGQFAAASISPLFFLRLGADADASASEPVVRWLIGGAALLAASLTMGATFSQASVFGPLDSAKVPIVIMPLSELKDVNGTTILTPSPTGDQCGRVKWCTPYLIPGLRIDHRLGWIVVDRTDPSTGEPSWSPARHVREGGAR